MPGTGLYTNFRSSIIKVQHRRKKHRKLTSPDVPKNLIHVRLAKHYGSEELAAVEVRSAMLAKQTVRKHQASLRAEGVSLTFKTESATYEDYSGENLEHRRWETVWIDAVIDPDRFTSDAPFYIGCTSCACPSSLRCHNTKHQSARTVHHCWRRRGAQR